MSQSLPSSPDRKAKAVVVRPPPPRPAVRSVSTIWDTPMSLASFSDSETTRDETKETSIAACVPEHFKTLWDIVTNGLKWEPNQCTMPCDIQMSYIELIQANRCLQEKLKTDKWVRRLLDDHFADVIEHCDDIVTGRITKTMGNGFILSLVDPSQLGFRRFWVDCIIGSQQKHALARRSVNEFMNIVIPRPQGSKSAPATFSAPTTPVSLSPVYNKVHEKITGRFDELIRLGRFMLGTMKEMESTPLRFGMNYQPLNKDDYEIARKVIRWAEDIVKSYTFDPAQRLEARNFVRSAKSMFSGDRLVPLEIRFKEWGILEYTKLENGNLHGPPHPVSGTSISLPGPTEGHQKTLLLRHIYLVERHVSAIWREFFLAVELCLDVQLACYQWHHVMRDRYHEAVRKIKDTRRRPDMRLYIGLKEQRAGKKLNRWH